MGKATSMQEALVLLWLMPAAEVGSQVVWFRVLGVGFRLLSSASFAGSTVSFPNLLRAPKRAKITLAVKEDPHTALNPKP